MKSLLARWLLCIVILLSSSDCKAADQSQSTQGLRPGQRSLSFQLSVRSYIKAAAGTPYREPSGRTGSFARLLVNWHQANHASMLPCMAVSSRTASAILRSVTASWGAAAVLSLPCSSPATACYRGDAICPDANWPSASDSSCSCCFRLRLYSA